MTLIAGLGNPGAEYAGTRHNIGYEAADHLSEALSAPFRPFDSTYLLSEGSFKGEPVRIIKPLTFMNRSGLAVRKAIQQFGSPHDRVMICYDDINLDPGRIRIRSGGSAGGHNGLSDIIATLGTDRIPRLRIGIGSHFNKGRLTDYVLSPFTNEERTLMDRTLDDTTEALLTFIRAGVHKAMNNHN